MEAFKTTIDSNKYVPARTASGKNKKKCPHCEMEGYHKLEKCFELEANARKRIANWKSKKST